LLFSDSIWKEGSYCTGIWGAELFGVEIPEEKKRMEEAYGEPTAWQETQNGESAFYQYLFDDNIEVRFYANSEGMLPDKNMLVKLADTDELYGNIDFAYGEIDFLPPSTRDGNEWENMNRYISYMGKTLEEIHIDYPELEYSTETFYYEDNNSGVRFAVSDNNRCETVSVPASLILAGLGENPVTRKRLSDNFKTGYSWYVEEYCFYLYVFEDFFIYIVSDIDGTIPMNCSIDIKEAM
jgi:hypothetical protein